MFDVLGYHGGTRRRPGAVTRTDVSELGVCPNCGAAIPRQWLLIEYERADGNLGLYAECPECNEVVCPQ